MLFFYDKISLANQSPISLVLNALLPSAKSSVTIDFSRDESTTLLIKSASSFRLNVSSNIIAADKIVANGFAMFFPVAWGYDPWIGSNKDVSVPNYLISYYINTLIETMS